MKWNFSTELEISTYFQLIWNLFDFIVNLTWIDKVREQFFITIGCVTFESFHDFEEIYFNKSLNFHGFLMRIELNASIL